MVASSFLLVSLATLALGKPTVRNLKLHETRQGAPSGFSLTGSADPNHTLKLRLALVQGNVAELERRLYDVSTPSSANYGMHLSKPEVQQLIAPAQSSVDAVNAWLKENSITAKTISAVGDWLSFEVPVSKANELFDANFSVFKHDDTGVEAVRTLSYSIPAELQGHLDLVHPTVTFPEPNDLPIDPVLGELGPVLPDLGLSLRDVDPTADETTPGIENLGAQTIPSGCSSTITPACLQAIYNIPTAHATQSSNRLAVAGFVRQYANQADLQSFLKQYRPDIQSNTTFALQTLDGGSNPQDPSKAGSEANLDIQYTVGIATGVPTVFISSGRGDITGWLDLANSLLDEDAPPSVLTTSYGFTEGNLSPNLARNLCNQYAALGARGVSLLFSSGDGGVSGSRLNNSCTSFVPTFPSTCPFVTSVGATQGVPETAAALSAGGFSNLFAAPAYQTSAVDDYVSALGGTDSGRYNASGRGYPDVAAQGVRYAVVLRGKGVLLDGTSASSPVFASVVALLNDGLVAKGKKPLGFLNPLLYSADGAAALNDVASGSNPGCGTSGFPAKKGWDPVTGLGTPDFEKLARAVGL